MDLQGDDVAREGSDVDFQGDDADREGNGSPPDSTPLNRGSSDGEWAGERSDRKGRGMRRCPPSEAPINLLAMSDLDDQHEQPVVLNLIDDPVVTYSDPVQLFRGLKLGGFVWAWVLSQLLDAGQDPFLRVAIELPDLTACGG